MLVPGGRTKLSVAVGIASAAVAAVGLSPVGRLFSRLATWHEIEDIASDLVTPIKDCHVSEIPECLWALPLYGKVGYTFGLAMLAFLLFVLRRLLRRDLRNSAKSLRQSAPQTSQPRVSSPEISPTELPHPDAIQALLRTANDEPAGKIVIVQRQTNETIIVVEGTETSLAPILNIDANSRQTPDKPRVPSISSSLAALTSCRDPIRCLSFRPHGAPGCFLSRCRVGA